MIKTVTNPNNIEIILTPNRSLSTEQAQWVVFGVCTFVFFIALFWSMQGAFLVLPFAGLDIILFAYVMFKINKEGLRKQLITIDSEKVMVQSGLSEIKESWNLSRPDTVLIVAEPLNKKPLGLKLSDSKSHCELGVFLNSNDKVELRESLKQSGLMEMSEKWWKPLR